MGKALWAVNELVNIPAFDAKLSLVQRAGFAGDSAHHAAFEDFQI
jgi:hypothetical protein